MVFKYLSYKDDDPEETQVQVQVLHLGVLVEEVLGEEVQDFKMANINWVQLDTASSVTSFLTELFEAFKNVEILGITEEKRFNVWYKFKEKKE